MKTKLTASKKAIIIAGFAAFIAALVALAGASVAHAAGLFEQGPLAQLLGTEKKVYMTNSADEDPFNDDLVCYYSFNHPNERATQVPDDSGNQNIGTISFSDTGESREIKKVNIFGNEKKVLEINKEDGDTHVIVPKTAFQTMTGEGSSLTASAWVNIYSNSEGWARIFDFGTGTDQYLYVLTNGSNTGFEGYASALKTDATHREVGMCKQDDISKNVWVLATVTIDAAGNMMLYLNGQPVADEVVHTGSTVADLATAIVNQTATDSHCYLGKSNYNDPCTRGMFTDFKLYKRALSAEEVAQLFDADDTQIAKADADAIDLGDVSALENDIYLPAEGAYGSTITWTSDNAAISIADTPQQDPETGKYYYLATVTRPPSTAEDAKVNLTAKVTYKTGKATRVIEANVHRKSRDEEIVETELKQVLSRVNGFVFEGDDLISAEELATYESSFKWTSETPNVEIAENQVTLIERPSTGSTAITSKIRCEATLNNAHRSGYIDIVIYPYDTSKNIDESATTLVKEFPSIKGGSYPVLPNYWDVVFKDGTKAKVKVAWDYDNKDALTEEQAAAGITGNLRGFSTTVTAKPSSTGSDEDPTLKAENFSLDEIDLTGDSFLTENMQRDVTYLKVLGESTPDPARQNKPVMRMLYNFYITGQIYDAQQLSDLGIKPLGGWDEPTCMLRGHSTGHYISALAQAYASTGDEEIKTILTNMLSEMADIQKESSNDPNFTSADFTPIIYADDDHYLKNPVTRAHILPRALDWDNWTTDRTKFGYGYIGSYSPDQFVLLEMGADYNGAPGQGIWAPYYTMHKLIAGFIDAYEYLPADTTARTNAYNLATGLGGWASVRVNKIMTDEQGGQDILTGMWTRYIAGECGGMNEVLAKLYKITNKDIYKVGSQCFDNLVMDNNISIGRDDYTNHSQGGMQGDVGTGGIRHMHANQNIPPIIGTLMEYKYGFTRAEKSSDFYYNVANNFWHLVSGHYAYSIGGVGTEERFMIPYKEAQHIKDDDNCETCCAYNLLKLTMQLNNFNPENAEYMDYYERTLYNQIFASQNCESGESSHNGTTYMMPIGPGAARDYGGVSSDWYDFSCCHGTGMENHVKYQEATYFHSSDNSKLYVGLYLPTSLDWKAKNLTITQEMSYPSDTSTIKVSGSGSSTFDLSLRVPYWAIAGFNVTLNGKAIDTSSASVSSYFTVSGVKSGDVITVNTPWTFHIDYTADKISDLRVGSLMYGPYVMSAQTDDTHLKTLYFTNDISKSIELKGKDERGLPIIATNNLTFYAMPSNVLCSTTYSAYSKIYVDGVDSGEANSADTTDNTNKSGDWFYALSSALDPINPDPPTPVPDPEPEYVDANGAGTSATGDNSALIMVVISLVAVGGITVLKFSKRKLAK